MLGVPENHGTLYGLTSVQYEQHANARPLRFPTHMVATH